MRASDAELDTASGPVTVASTYVHAGEADTARQEEKYSFLDAMTERMARASRSGERMVVAGDLNIAHHEVDLRNWKGNLRKSGFLEGERAHLDAWLGERPGSTW